MQRQFRPKNRNGSIEVNVSGIDLGENDTQWAHTKSTLYDINFKWTIDNISFRQECLKSPTFSSDANDQIKWSLILYPKAENDYLAIFLQLESEPCQSSNVFAQFKLYILNADRNKAYTKSFPTERFKLHNPVGSPTFAERFILFDKTKNFIEHDQLKIVCKIDFVADSIDISSQRRKFKIPKCNITDNFGSLLSSEKFSDITLVVGEYEFPAHKAILAGRSQVFAAMFEHNMEEVKTGRVTITDINRKVLQETLNFIYTEKAPNLGEMANEILAAADKYALETLKVMCEEEIFDKLTLETALETLVLADLHNASQLKEEIIHFISENAKEILKTKEWQNMKKDIGYSTLISETLEDIIMHNM